MSVASKGTNRGSRDGVVEPDGVGVSRLKSDPSTGDAKMSDQRVAIALENMEDVLERIQSQLAQINGGSNLAHGERFE